MGDKKVQEKLPYQNVFRYLTERSYSLNRDKEWKMSIHRIAAYFVVKDGHLV